MEGYFSRCNVGILTDYRGLTTAELTALRRKLEESKLEYKVVKNTLARIAAEKTGKNNLASLLEGPVAIVFGKEDIIEPAKVLTEYARTTKTSLNVKGGFVGNKVLTSQDIVAIAKLPSREVLLARVVGGMQSPISALVNTLAAPIRGFMTVLQARMKQLEGG